MGATPCTNGITIEFGCQFRVELTDGSLVSYKKYFYTFRYSSVNIGYFNGTIDDVRLYRGTGFI